MLIRNDNHLLKMTLESVLGLKLDKLLIRLAEVQEKLQRGTHSFNNNVIHLIT